LGGSMSIITAELFTATGWSDPVEVVEINPRNVMHDGKLYSYMFHRRAGQVKRAPIANRTRANIAKKRATIGQGDKVIAGTGTDKGKASQRRKTHLRDSSPIVAAHSRCQKVRGPDGWIAGPYSEHERGMMASVKGRKVKYNGKWWVVK